MGYHGSLAAVQIGTEAVAYGTAAATLVDAPASGVQIEFREDRQQSPVIGFAGMSANHGVRLSSHTEGRIEYSLITERDFIGPQYLNAGGVLAGSVYTFGGTEDVDVALGMTLVAYYTRATSTAVGVTHTGLVTRSLTWQLNGGGQFAGLTADVIGRAAAHATNLTTPAVPNFALVSTSGLVEMTGLTLGKLDNATITYSRVVSGPERLRFGSALLPLPTLHDQRPTITAVLNVDTDANAMTELNKLLINSAADNITIGNFALTGCRMFGQIPPLTGGGYLKASLEFRATALAVTTEAA